MAKQVQKTSSKKLKLYIISTIKNKNKLPDDVAKNKCNYHLKPFLKAGLVIKKGYGVWELTKKGEVYLDKKELQLLSLDTSFVIGKTKVQKIRGHGFMWKLKLPSRAYYSQEQRIKLLKRAKKECLPLHNKTIKTTIRDHKVHLAGRSIIIYFNKEISYIGKTALDSYREALFEFNKLINILERYYGVSLRIRKNYKFKVCKNHYGDLDNEFAVHYRKEGQFVRVFDEGKEWLVIDFSDNKFTETETTQTGRAKYDMDNIITPTMNTLRHDPHLLKNLKEENEELKKMFADTQKIVRHLLEKEGSAINFDTFKY